MKALLVVMFVLQTAALAAVLGWEGIGRGGGVAGETPAVRGGGGGLPQTGSPRYTGEVEAKRNFAVRGGAECLEDVLLEML